MKNETLMIGVLAASLAVMMGGHACAEDYDLLSDDVAPTPPRLPKMKERGQAMQPLDEPRREIREKSDSLLRMLKNKRRR